MVRDMLIFCLGRGRARLSPAQRRPANSRKKIHGFYSMLSAQASSWEDLDIYISFSLHIKTIHIHVVFINYDYYLRRIFTSANVVGLSVCVFVCLSLQFTFHVLKKSFYATIDRATSCVPLENAWTENCLTSLTPNLYQANIPWNPMWRLFRFRYTAN